MRLPITLASLALALLLTACSTSATPVPPSVPTPAAQTVPPATATAAPPTATPAVAEAATAEAAAALLPTWTPIATPAPGVLVVDAGQPLGPISPYLFGTNYGPWVSLRMETLPLAEKAGISVIRYPGGEWGDHNQLQSYQIDQLVELAQRMGAEPYLHVRFLDSTPAEAASIVQYVKDKGYSVRFWSIGNEPSIYEGGGNEWTADKFAEEWRAFAAAMRAVDPNIVLIGPEIHQFTGDPASDPKDSLGQDWMRTFLQRNGDLVDIVSFHRYPFPLSINGGAATVAQLRADPPRWDETIRSLRTLVRDLTGRDLPVAATEFNSHWTRIINGETTPDSLLSALWLGDVLGRLVAQRVDLATQFLLVSGSDHSGFGLLDRYDARPAYYVYTLYKQFGRQQLFSSADVPDVSLHAALRDDGALTLMAINLGDGEAAAPLQLRGFRPGGPAHLWRLDAEHKGEPVADEAVEDGGLLRLPPRSMTLYVVEP